MGVTAVAILIQYLKVKQPAAKKQEEQESRAEEPELPEIKIDPQELSYICINTVDLAEIIQILTTFKKRFVIQGPP